MVPIYVAFLRAVNVGGRYYKMAELREHLTESGLSEVETYIQTGNLRVSSRKRTPAAVEKQVEQVLADHAGFEVPTVAMTPDELTATRQEARELSPGRPGPDQRQYVSFFKVALGAEATAAIEAWAEPGERAFVRGRHVHVCLNGVPFHEARIFGRLKRHLAPGTVRDLKVVDTLAERWGT